MIAYRQLYRSTGKSYLSIVGEIVGERFLLLTSFPLRQNETRAESVMYRKFFLSVNLVQRFYRTGSSPFVPSFYSFLWSAFPTSIKKSGAIFSGVFFFLN